MLSFTNFTYRKRSITEGVFFQLSKMVRGLFEGWGFYFLEIFILNLVGVLFEGGVFSRWGYSN